MDVPHPLPPLPAGFKLAGVHSGVKRNPEKEDLSLIVTDQPVVAAGVYTQNRVCAAPVVLDRQRTPTANARAVVINSGNANACTGGQGEADAMEATRLVGQACGIDPKQVLVLSTGIIGEFLNMEKIAAGIEATAKKLGSDEASLLAAARGMLTTDAYPKIAGKNCEIGEQSYQVTGLAKGAAMIGPNMATMLGVVLTDAPLTPTSAQQLLTDVVNETFNCISVEGHTSTNDTVLLLSSGDSEKSLQGNDLAQLRTAITEVCTDLARSIPNDGEGASHLITIEVQGAETVADAQQIAKTIAGSALVKTAVTGGDPNWGRIVSAAGYAGVLFNPAGVDLEVNGHLLYEQGAPAKFDAKEVSQSIKANRETYLLLRLKEGAASARFWTSDLTIQYVEFNAHYHT